MKEEMTCEQCGRKFKGKMHLQKHINKDHNFKQCTLCGVEVKAVYFKRHMLAKHTDDSEMPYQCSVCHKGFCKKQTYQSHMNIHTGNVVTQRRARLEQNLCVLLFLQVKSPTAADSATENSETMPTAWNTWGNRTLNNGKLTKRTRGNLPSSRRHSIRLSTC